MRRNSNASLHVCAVPMHDEVLEGDEVVEYLEEYLERSPSLDPTFANVGYQRAATGLCAGRWLRSIDRAVTAT